MLYSFRLSTTQTFLTAFVLIAMTTNNCVLAQDNPSRAVLCQSRTLVSSNLRLSDTGSVTEELSASGGHVACIQGYGPATGLASWLEHQTTLEELSLICVCLNESDVQAICRLPRLSHLDLRGCELSDDQLTRLCSMEISAERW